MKSLIVLCDVESFSVSAMLCSRSEAVSIGLALVKFFLKQHVVTSVNSVTVATLNHYTL